VDAGVDAGSGTGECVTCGDRASRMRVLEVLELQGLALCLDGDGSQRAVETGLLGAVAPGDTLLVHAGTALAREAGAGA
jgi:hydrogenase maturation factor